MSFELSRVVDGAVRELDWVVRGGLNVLKFDVGDKVI